MITLLLFLSGIILMLWGFNEISEVKKIESEVIEHNNKILMLNQRRNALIECYGDPDIADKILNREFWEGQTAAQLEDSIGLPLDIDKVERINITREVWKYNKTGKNRYGLKITLVNNKVIGWDLKSNL